MFIYRKIVALLFIVSVALTTACQPIVAPVERTAAEPPVAAQNAEASTTVSVAEQIANAMSAGPVVIAEAATIARLPDDYPGNYPNGPYALNLVELRPGTNGWTCIANDPNSPGNDPMCLNKTYLEALIARHAMVDGPSSGIGIGYMLQEGIPAGSPPHMMVFVPGSNDGLDAFSAAPGPLPWVMFPDTTYAHLMVTMVPSPERIAVEDRIANAMSAGPAVVADEATIADWPEGYPGNWPNEPYELNLVELRPGTNGWTCIADTPNSPGNDPMCLNETYLAVLKARHAMVDGPSNGIGIGYMLQEGIPAGSPPHMMIFVPGSNDSLDAFGIEPGPLPWVMFPDTSYAHLMVTILHNDN